LPADVITDTGAYRLAFGKTMGKGLDKYELSSLDRTARSSMIGLSPFQIAGSYHWKDSNTLELVLRYIETPHTQTMTLPVDQRKLSAIIHNSFEWNNKGTAWEGEIK